MNLQQSSAVELFVTVNAVVFFLAFHLACMSTQVLSEIVFAAEQAAANLTFYETESIPDEPV
jgi:hypothetical protein